jgi:signal transduction protein with GAF and PtsI domain
MPEPTENSLPEKMQSLLETFDVANILTEPLTRSIEHLLRVSASTMNSEEASVLVRDGDEGDLRFLSATGKVAERLLNLRIPAGKGIAGFVLSSGQPMAVADVGEEQNFYDEVDKTTGYSTQTILATPLRYNGEIIGVLEYVNRTGDPPYESFTPEEMDKAALFAEPIASLVNAYESAKIFRELGEKLMTDKTKKDYSEVRNWIETLRDSAEHREMMDLAVLLREVSSRGENERLLCRELLESILRYSDSKAETSYLSF